MHAVDTEVSGVLIHTMVMSGGFGPMRFSRLGDQSDHFQ